MVFIITKKIKGHEYLYLVKSIKKNNKSKHQTIKYIGKKRPIPKTELECMKLSYDNKDWILEQQKDTLSYQEHNKMKQASNNQKEHINSLNNTSKEKEKEKFLSIFISNSNTLEGSTLSVQDTFNYLFNEIIPEGKTKKELFMADNLLKAWNYVETNYKKFPTENDLKILHKLTNINIEEESTLGKYKKSQNYIGDILTTSHLFVEEKMTTLMKWIKTAYKKINNFEVAFQSHAQFEVIHPFIDGNGRVGRLLINWLLKYKKLEPIAIPSNKRAKYLSALDNSRRGKVEAIVKFSCESYLEQYEFN